MDWVVRHSTVTWPVTLRNMRFSIFKRVLHLQSLCQLAPELQRGAQDSRNHMPLGRSNARLKVQLESQPTHPLTDLVYSLTATSCRLLGATNENMLVEMCKLASLLALSSSTMPCSFVFALLRRGRTPRLASVLFSARSVRGNETKPLSCEITWARQLLSRISTTVVLEKARLLA